MREIRRYFAQNKYLLNYFKSKKITYTSYLYCELKRHLSNLFKYPKDKKLTRCYREPSSIRTKTNINMIVDKEYKYIINIFRHNRDIKKPCEFCILKKRYPKNILTKDMD